MFTESVTQGEDGQYRWSYDLRAHHNNDMLFLALKIAMAVSVPAALLVLATAFRYNPPLVISCCVGLIAFTALLLGLLFRFAIVNLGYRLSESALESWPKAKNSDGIFFLRNIRRIKLCPERDLILLRARVFSARVYVRQEDYELVQSLIRDRAPQGTEVLK